MAVAEWRRWYDLPRWRKKAKRQKQLFPLCKMCLEKNLVSPAEVADHVIPHKGDKQLFWFGELQSLCNPCHSKTKQQLEVRGYTTEIGLDGWPVDPNHPVRKFG